MLYIFLRQLFRLLFKVLFRLKAYGTENIPKDGPVVLCSNHISLLDPPAIGTLLERKVHYMAKAELFRIPLLGLIIHKVGAFPVKRGGVSKEAIRTALQLLGEGKMLGIFPEGTRGSGLGMGKKGAASLALRSKATVIPVAIAGSYKLFRSTNIYYGKPIDLTQYSDGNSSELQEKATEKIMNAIEQLLLNNKS